MTQSTLNHLHRNEYTQGKHCYLFAVKLDSLKGSFNTLNDLSNKVCATNKTNYLNLSVFNMIKGRSDLKYGQNLIRYLVEKKLQS